MPRFEGAEATIHYEQIGNGLDIVWVAGGGGLAEDWAPVALVGLSFGAAIVQQVALDRRAAPLRDRHGHRRASWVTASSGPSFVRSS